MTLLAVKLGLPVQCVDKNCFLSHQLELDTRELLAIIQPLKHPDLLGHRSDFAVLTESAPDLVALQNTDGHLLLPL